MDASNSYVPSLLSVNPSTSDSVVNVSVAPSGRSTSSAWISPWIMVSSANAAVWAVAVGRSFVPVIVIAISLVVPSVAVSVMISIAVSPSPKD